jgi:hypothetical protein
MQTGNTPESQLAALGLQLKVGKFEAKLNMHERCQILALRMAGMSLGAIAVTFGVNRRTVTHIQNPDSPRYRSVREARDAMGTDAFKAKYITQELVERVKAAALTAEAQDTYANTDAAKNIHPNKRANRCAGITMHKGPHHAFTHRIEIGWVENEPGYPNGWYHKLLDTGEPTDAENWGGDPDVKSHHTSASALQYARNYLDENY